jgi:sugar phosphate isomerase/epimerase
MQLGCSTILYGGYDLDTALDGIRKAGYRAIELCALSGMADHLKDGHPDDYYRILREKAADRGLAIEAIGASTNLLDEGARARFIRLMQAGQKLGTTAITTGSGGQSDDEASFKQVVEAIHGLEKAAADTGVRISIKPHVRSAVYSTKTALRFMKEVDSRWVGLNVDASHLWRTPEQEVPEETLPQLAPFITTVRVRDTLSRDIPIGPVETQIPGRGGMNMPAICAALRAVKGVDYAVLEIVGSKGFALAEVQRVVEACKQALDPYFA